MKYIATFQVKFDPKMMCDKGELKKTFGGSWDKCIEWLFKEEGMGIFNEDFEFIRVIK